MWGCGVHRESRDRYDRNIIKRKSAHVPDSGWFTSWARERKKRVFTCGYHESHVWCWTVFQNTRPCVAGISTHDRTAETNKARRILRWSWSLFVLQDDRCTTIRVRLRRSSRRPSRRSQDVHAQLGHYHWQYQMAGGIPPDVEKETSYLTPQENDVRRGLDIYSYGKMTAAFGSQSKKRGLNGIYYLKFKGVSLPWLDFK